MLCNCVKCVHLGHGACTPIIEMIEWEGVPVDLIEECERVSKMIMEAMCLPRKNLKINGTVIFDE